MNFNCKGTDFLHAIFKGDSLVADWEQLIALSLSNALCINRKYK